MLTDQDIQKLKKIVATKEDIKEIRKEIGGLRSYTEKGFEEVRDEITGLRSYTEKGFEEIHDDHDDLNTMVQGLAVSVDGLVKSVTDLRIDHAAVLGTLDRHERWHKQTAEKVGVHLDAL
ncbi:MAG: hypothetical protein HYY60_00280 [Parcubacteria group bacterium]|nr:hypothetical protein [Parcubacteria group bacterium]